MGLQGSPAFLSTGLRGTAPSSIPTGEDATPGATWKMPESASATHAGTAHGNNEEGLQDTGGPHDPRQPQEENHTQDVLQAGQVHTDEGAHARSLEESTHLWLRSEVRGTEGPEEGFR